MKKIIRFWSYVAQFFLEEKCFRQKMYRQSKHTFCVQ